MNKLEEIFKDKPELLQEPAVQELIAYVQEQFQQQNERLLALSTRNLKAMDIAANCEAMVVGGEPTDEAILRIFEAL